MIFYVYYISAVSNFSYFSNDHNISYPRFSQLFVSTVSNAYDALYYLFIQFHY